MTPSRDAVLARDAIVAGALALFVVVLSLFPFHPLRSEEAMQGLMANFFSYSVEPPILRTVLERVVTVLPLGFFLGRLGRRLSVRALCLLSVLGSFLFCLTVEVMQFPVEGRHPRSSDALLAMWCFSSGLLLAARLYRPARTGARALALLLIVWPGLLALGAWWIGPSTLNWTTRYPVLLGDEYGGKRTWTGEIAGVALYPFGLDEDAIRQLAATPFSPSHAYGPIRSDALWIYSGDDDTGVAKTPLVFPPAAPSRRAAPPPDLGTVLAGAVRRSDGIAIELKLRSGALAQWGPARIVTSSRTVWLRNFTVAQQGSGFDFRLRTFSSGANGTGFEIATPPGTVTGDWQDVVANYKNGQARLYIDGKPVAGPVSYDGFRGTGGEISAPALVALLSLFTGLFAYGSCLWGDRRAARR